MAHRFEVALLFALRQSTLGLCQGECQQEQPGELCCKGFCRRHTDFHTGTGDIGQAALAHHGAGGHIANGQGVFHAQTLRVAQRGQGVSRFARLRDGDHQRPGVGHRVAVPVFAGNLHLRGHLGNTLQPVLGRATAVVAGATGQNQHRVNLGKHPGCVGTRRMVHLLVEQLGNDALHALQRVGNGTRLLEYLLLHVMAIRPELGGSTVRHDGLDRALRRSNRLVCLVHQPILAQLHIHLIAFFQVDDLVGHTGQCHGVTGQKMLLPVLAHAQYQG